MHVAYSTTIQRNLLFKCCKECQVKLETVSGYRNIAIAIGIIFMFAFVIIFLKRYKKIFQNFKFNNL